MRIGIFGLIVFLGLVGSVGHAAKSGTFNLGPTGLIGSVKKNTAKVTVVAKGSPADGKLKKGDEIIGAGGATFKKDFRRELAAAIDQAETKAGGGKLTLRLKGGKTVDLQLAVLGSYSKTAPYDCPKSDAIITRAAQSLIKSEKVGKGRLRMAVLGLLATGEKKYVDIASEAIRNAEWAKPDPAEIESVLAGTAASGYVGWSWSYSLVALSEYYLMSGDKSVLPGIETYALGLARGQDAGGLWGHRMISKQRNNRLPGYAQINQTSLVCFMSMLMAKKCGVKHPDLDRAIERTNAFYASFIHEGAFNYGVHGPNTKSYNNNGTSGTGALAMSFIGNREGAQFFSQLSATSYDGLETGHASTYFNPLWTPLGANLSGPEVTQQFFQRSLWLQTMFRCWDGRFQRFEKGGKEGPQAGPALLTYCLPRKALYITGKNADTSIWVRGQAAKDVIALSKTDFKSKRTEELLQLVNHPIPQIRRGANWQLNDQRKALTPTYLKLMKSGTLYEKQAAVGTFGYWAPQDQRTSVMDALGEVLVNKKEAPETRAAAASSLAWTGEPARKYFGDMVNFLAEKRPNDRFGEVDASVGASLNILSKTPFKDGLVKDTKTYYQAALKLAANPRQNARAEGLKLLAGMPKEDFHVAADAVIGIIEDKNSSYHSYHNPGGPSGAALTILANLGIKEGIQLALDIHDQPTGKASFKMHACWSALTKYGGNAKPALEQLRVKYKGRTDFGRHTGKYKAMVKAIEGDQNPRPLITLAEARK